MKLPEEMIELEGDIFVLPNIYYVGGVYWDDNNNSVFEINGQKIVFPDETNDDYEVTKDGDDMADAAHKKLINALKKYWDAD